MKRMEFRSSEAPMDWEREQDRNTPSIFDTPRESNPPHAAPTRSFSTSAATGDVRREFSFSSVQSCNNNGRSQSPGWDSSTSKPFRQDSQLSAGEPLSHPTTLQRHGSFPLTGVSHRSLTSRSSSPLFGSGSDEGPTSGSAMPSGLFDMGSLTGDISDKGKFPARKLPSTHLSSLRYRTSNVVSDDEDQGGSTQERDSSMSEDDSSRHRRLSLRKSKSRQTHQGHGTFRQSLPRGENLHDPYYQQQPQPPQHASGSQARAWSENVDLPYILSG
ncbi:hypothetical protein BGZ92_005576 [Podila epicladia]|nr:hypothetical protein BGZ92_005576 [Podila epicladia]